MSSTLTASHKLPGFIKVCCASSYCLKHGAADTSCDMRTLPPCSAGIRIHYVPTDGSAVCMRRPAATDRCAVLGHLCKTMQLPDQLLIALRDMSSPTLSFMNLASYSQLQSQSSGPHCLHLHRRRPLPDPQLHLLVACSRFGMLWHWHSWAKCLVQAYMYTLTKCGLSNGLCKAKQQHWLHRRLGVWQEFLLHQPVICVSGPDWIQVACCSKEICHSEE